MPVMAGGLGPAVHHSIVVVDVEGFGARRRTRSDQGAIRHGLYQALELAFTRSGIGWGDCYREDRGDGVLILLSAQVPKEVLAAGVPGELAMAVRAHNQAHNRDARIRLRVALHGGEVVHDAYGVTGTAVTVAFRLLEAEPLKQALAGSPGVLAVITSEWFYEEVIRHSGECAPATWRRVQVTVKETRQEGWISLPDAPYPAHPDAHLLPVPPAAAQVRYSLPPDTAAFTGRREEVDEIMAAVAGDGGTGGAVAVRAIDGMPGVGKTALAIHVAHALSDRFPDWQLFLDLHAHTPGREPMAAEDALAGLLSATGMDPRFVPGDLDGRAAMWRSRMAGQRALLVLDNAASSGQVAPLLPGGGNCLVLVTSRRHLGDLPGTVVPVFLDVLSAEQAEEMFTRLAPRAATDPDGVRKVSRLAGHLPLAMSLLARVYARHRSWTLADLAADTSGNLLTLTAENNTIAAAFEVSYRHLNPALRQFFDLLGVHPGTTTDSYAAAALTGTSVAEADGMLDALHREGLVTETGHRRYGMHDLLRRYARDHAATDPGAEQALDRLLDYYQQTAALAEALLAQQAQSRPAAASPAAPPIAIPDLPDSTRALAWARTERSNLLACLDQAIHTGQEARAAALTAAMAALLRLDGPWADAIARHVIAIQAARHLGDQFGEAGALINLGVVRRLTGDIPAACAVLEEALDIYRSLGDRQGQAGALSSLGSARRLTGQFPAAGAVLEEALDIYRSLGDRRGQAGALSNLGIVRRQTGDFPRASEALEQALSIYHDLGDRLGQVSALNDLGVVRIGTADYPGASAVLEEALDISRDLGDRLGQGNALNYLGDVRRLTGDYAAAAAALEEALGIYRDLGDPRGQGNALSNLGDVRRLTGDYAAAAAALEEALGIYPDELSRAGALYYLGVVRRQTADYAGASAALEAARGIFHDLGDRSAEATALNEIGTLHLACGKPAEAEACHQQALELARAIGSSWDEAHALVGLGHAALATGRSASAGAEALLRQAHSILQQTGAAEAADVAAELQALTGTGPVTPENPDHPH